MEREEQERIEREKIEREEQIDKEKKYNTYNNAKENGATNIMLNFHKKKFKVNTLIYSNLWN